MTIVYCSWATGNDTTGDGTAGNPWKTIDKATTSRTGGDEVRVAKSPDPTALTGTLGFTENNTAVTGSGTLFSTELAQGDFIEGGDGHWYEVVTITNNTSAALNRVYPSATQSGVSSRKLGVTDTGAASTQTTTIQATSAQGTPASRLKISGGWDLSGTPAQTGQTWFRQMHGTFGNRWGYGINLPGLGCLEIERCHFLRYYYGIRTALAKYCLLTALTCSSNGSSGMYIGSSSDAMQLVSPTCNSNGGTAIYISGDTYGAEITSPTCYSNNGNAINMTSNWRIRGTLRTARNANWPINVGAGNLVVVENAVIGEGARASGWQNYQNARVQINNIGGQSEIWTDGGDIVSQNATAGGTGKEWRFNVTSNTRTSNYPLRLRVAAVAVAANAQVTVTLYFKKSGTGIAGRLMVPGGQIAGVTSDVSTTCPDNTSRNQVQVQFTPTAAGVVEVYADAWYVSATDQNVLVDDLAVSQA